VPITLSVSDGDITQMVYEEDIAWHCSGYNSVSIGIEHEGYVADGDQWYTPNLYESSANVTAYMCYCYGIPRDRSHIMGHEELAYYKEDPGEDWDWDYYMGRVSYWYNWYVQHN